jgi:hypothetical protein
MNIPGYDDWKLRTPEDDYEAGGGRICPFCGAYSTNSCELEDETDGVCAWDEAEEGPDPDYLRDLRNDR